MGPGTGDPALVPAREAALIPDLLKPWAHIAVLHRTDGLPGIRRAVRSRDTEELEEMARRIPEQLAVVPDFLADLGLPVPDEPSIWELALPEIRAEIRRRQRPVRKWATGGSISRLKGMDLVAVASRFTYLRPSGVKQRGLCPIHGENSPSFFVDPQIQRWSCFGCHRHGDVVDLLDALAEQGRHL